MLSTKTEKKNHMKKLRQWAPWHGITSSSLSIVIGVAALISMPLVYADSIQQQINTLNTQNAQTQQTVDSLSLQAASYQDAINQLQSQINAIQQAIHASQDKQAQLEQQIQNDETEITHEKEVLGVDIKAMYAGGQLTTLEMLATSKNLSAFVDQQTYQKAVESHIQKTLAEITTLEFQQKQQQTEVAQLLQTQQAQNAQLNSDEQKQANLLSYTQQQQDQYNSQIAANKSKISQLVAEQAAINAALARSAYVAPSGGSGGACDIGQGNGGYPIAWCNTPFNFDYTPSDANGFPMRQCTSFAYWYFTSVEGKSLNQNNPSSLGDAGDWWQTADRPVDRTPERGAIGVEPRDAPPHYGPYGHVMIVLALPGETYSGYSGTVPSGYVLVMSMNEDEQGHFMYNLWPANTLYYIH